MQKNILSIFRRTTTSGQYYAEIDGLRFIAIAFVLIYHLSERSLRMFKNSGGVDPNAEFWHSFFLLGDLGVQLFFAISGYIISKPFLDRYALGKAGAFSAKKYYLRRVTRLEPPYFVAMTGIFLFLVVTGYHSELAKNFNETALPLWQSFLASITYTHTLWFDFEPKLNPPAWSLEIEIRFYLIAPLIMAAYFSLKSRWFARTSILVAILILLFFQSQWDGGSLINDKRSLTAYMHYFALGILLCDLHLFRPQEPQGNRTRAVYDIAALIALVLFASLERIHGPYVVKEIAKLGFIVLTFAGAFYGNLFRRALSLGFIATVGGMCYTIYLIHMPIMQVLAEKVENIFGLETFIAFFAFQAVIIMPAILLISAAFFLLVEKPCMQPDWPKRLWQTAKNIYTPRPQSS